MKNLKKNTLKTLVLIALICPAAFADGDMGGGGLTADNSPVKEEKVFSSTEGDMGGGGRVSEEGYINWLFESIQEYVGSII